ncbi:MAG: SgcJ/EcaC family oxidoreductase [Congregibacter sp.]
MNKKPMPVKTSLRDVLLPLMACVLLQFNQAVLAADPPLVVAHEMVNAWNAIDADQIADLFAQDGSYQSMMDTPVIGRELIRTKFTQLLAPATALELQLRNVAVAGGVVFLERVDVFTYNGREAAVPVVAVLEIKDGKVAAWREYFDRAELMHAMGLTGEH